MRAHVARHLGKTAQLALSVADGGQGYNRPEFRAILAQPPGFGLILALPLRLGQLPRRLARLRILVQKEDGVVLAQDLLGFVPLAAFRPGVPGDDAALRVEHVNGVVGHPLHQQPEPLFALHQRQAVLTQVLLSFPQVLLRLPQVLLRLPHIQNGPLQVLPSLLRAQSGVPQVLVSFLRLLAMPLQLLACLAGIHAGVRQFLVRPSRVAGLPHGLGELSCVLNSISLVLNNLSRVLDSLSLFLDGRRQRSR